MNDDGNLKLQFLDIVAKTGSTNVALTQLGLNYRVYRNWQQEDLTFNNEVSLAVRFYTNGLNQAIFAMSRQRLFEILKDGITQTITKTESITLKGCDGNGDRVELPATKMSITKKYLGPSMAAIREGLALLPSEWKSVERLMNMNALSATQAEQVQQYVLSFEQGLQEIIVGQKGDERQIDDDIISAIQRDIVGE